MWRILLSVAGVLAMVACSEPRTSRILAPHATRDSHSSPGDTVD
jgi:hypothetical protein